MRIIKDGKKKQECWRVICKDCGAEFEVEREDLKKEPLDRPTDPVRYSFKCPYCSYKNYIAYID